MPSRLLESPRVPLVSIVIPTFNAPDFLLETLSTVFAQTFNDFEVILINDGSTDDTLARLKTLQERHSQQLIIITQPNAGIGAARNRGIEESHGKYIAFLDHDDLWRPEKLARQLKFMEANPGCASCGTLYALSPNPDKPHFALADVADDRGIVARPFSHQMHGRDVFLTSTMLIDREKTKGIRFATTRGAIEDVPFQIKLQTRGDYGIAGNEILAIYRMHEANFSKIDTYYYAGIKLLRQMQRAGEFAGLLPEKTMDMQAWLAQIGRVATLRQIGLHRRFRGFELYLREFPWQIRDGRVKFLLAAPILLMTPNEVLRRVTQRH
jgi:glycosyltransferase involved in cell wall biosynthesis